MRLGSLMILFASFFICPSVLSQTKPKPKPKAFYVTATGTANTCTPRNLTKPGSLSTYVQVIDPQPGETGCKDKGAAVSTIFAELPATSTGLRGNVVGTGSGIATGKSLSFDTVTLTPPKGFKDKEVPVTLKEGYTFTIEGTGNAVACWKAVSGKAILLDDCTQKFDQTTSGVFTKDFIVPSSKSGKFRFTIQKTLEVESGTATAGTGVKSLVNYISPGFTVYTFPSADWKCQFASGDICNIPKK